MLDLLSLHLLFSLVNYSADFHVFLRRWIHKLDKKVWILFIQKFNSKKILGKQHQERQATKKMDGS